MTTIDYQQAARMAVANTMRQIEPNLYKNPANPEIYYGHLADDAIRAAAPHLRAAWAEEVRELCEAAIKRANDPLAARGFYGEAFPATVYAQDILALLEGGAE